MTMLLTGAGLAVPGAGNTVRPEDVFDLLYYETINSGEAGGIGRSAMFSDRGGSTPLAAFGVVGNIAGTFGASIAQTADDTNKPTLSSTGLCFTDANQALLVETGQNVGGGEVKSIYACGTWHSGTRLRIFGHDSNPTIVEISVTGEVMITDNDTVDFTGPNLIIAAEPFFLVATFDGTDWYVATTGHATLATGSGAATGGISINLIGQNNNGANSRLAAFGFGSTLLTNEQIAGLSAFNAASGLPTL